MANFNFFLNRQGVSGRKGDKGEKGFSPSISIKTDTPTEFIMTIQNEFDSFDTPNIIPQAIGEEVTRLGEVSEQHTEQISQLGTEVNALQDITDAHTSDLEELGDKVKNNQEAILSNQSTIHNLGQSVQNMESKVSDLERNQSNLVTINTAQTITGRKTFGVTDFNGTLNISAGVGYEGGTISGSSVIGELVIKAQRLKLTNGDGTGTVILQGNALTLDANTGLILQNGGWKKDSATGNLKPLLTTDSIKAGENINIRTDDMAGTVTISAVGGGGSAPDLSNVVKTDVANQTIATTDTSSVGNTSLTIGRSNNATNLRVYGAGGNLNIYSGNSGAGLTSSKSLILSSGASSENITLKTTSATNQNQLKTENYYGTYDILHTGNLTAGSGITISEPDSSGVRTISSSGGGGDIPDLENYVTLDTTQTISGQKTFSNYKDATQIPLKIQNNAYASNDMPLVVFQGYNSYELGRITGYLTNTNTVENLTLKAGNSTSSSIHIKGYRGTLTLKNDTLTFTKSTGEVIDLLAGGGSSGTAPENMVTTDTVQNISAAKTFNGGLSASSMSATSSSSSVRTGLTGGIQFFDGVYTYGNEPKITTVSKSGGIYDLMLNAGKATYPDEMGNMPAGNVIDQDSNIFLTQGNVTQGNGITINKTAKGIEISSSAGSIDDSNYAKLSSSNTFNQNQIIKPYFGNSNGFVFTNDNVYPKLTFGATDGSSTDYIKSSGNGLQISTDDTLTIGDHNGSNGSFRKGYEINVGDGFHQYDSFSSKVKNTLEAYSSVGALHLGQSGYGDTDLDSMEKCLTIKGSVNTSTGDVKGIISASQGIEIYPDNKITGNAVKINSDGFTYGDKNVVVQDSDVMDGQWIYKRSDLLTEYNAPTTDTALDIASYLPKDDYQYEVMLSCIIATGSALNNTCTLKLNTSVYTASFLYLARVRTNAANSSGTSSGIGTIIIGKDRVFTLGGDSVNTGKISLGVHAYRRIGINK